MKRNFLYMTVMGIFILVLFNLSWGQCPEAPNDLGVCDTLYVEPWADTDTCFDYGSGITCVNNPGEEYPRFLHVSLFVTHDSNTFWWPSGSMYVQDSVSAYVTPLAFWHSSGSGKVTFPTWNRFNNNKMDPEHAWFSRSMFRYLIEEDGDTIYNRLAQMTGDPDYLGAWTPTSELDTLAGAGDSGHIFMSLIPVAGDCRRWWEGSRILLATLTFIVSDSMHFYLDSTFWFPTGHLELTRYDAVNYVPRHNLPLCIWVGPPRIEVTSPDGGETWVVGDNHDITWISEEFTDNVKIEYSTNEGGNWNTIIANTANDGVHPWTIPNTPSIQCRVRVSDAADGAPSDMSDGDFTITSPPDFSIEADPETVTVVAGGSGSCDVILTSLFGFSSLCALTLDEDSLPAYTTYDFDPDTVEPTNTSVLTFYTEVTTPPETSIIIVTGSEVTGGKNGIEHSTEVVLIVTPAPDFAMEVSPDTVKLYPAETDSFQIGLTSLFGFASPCTLSVEGLDTVGTGEFHPAVLTPPDTGFLVVTDTTIKEGVYPITITATELIGDKGIPVQHQKTVYLKVLPFCMVETDPDTQWVVQGNDTTFKVWLAINGTSNALCTLSVFNLPPWSTGEFAPPFIEPPGDTSILTIATADTTPEGEYTIGIEARFYGCIDTTEVVLIVTSQTDVEDEVDQGNVPNRFALFQNQPNPFNPETEISYYLAEGSQVKLTIYDILGRKVRTLFEGYQNAGMKTLVWNGRDDQGSQLGSGIYFYRLEAGSFKQTMKMTLLK